MPNDDDKKKGVFYRHIPDAKKIEASDRSDGSSDSDGIDSQLKREKDRLKKFWESKLIAEFSDESDSDNRATYLEGDVRTQVSVSDLEGESSTLDTYEPVNLDPKKADSSDSVVLDSTDLKKGSPEVQIKEKTRPVLDVSKIDSKSIEEFQKQLLTQIFNEATKMSSEIGAIKSEIESSVEALKETVNEVESTVKTSALPDRLAQRLAAIKNKTGQIRQSSDSIKSKRDLLSARTSS